MSEARAHGRARRSGLQATMCSSGERRDLVFVALPSVVVITEIIYKPVSKHFAELSVVLIITHNNI